MSNTFFICLPMLIILIAIGKDTFFYKINFFILRTILIICIVSTFFIDDKYIFLVVVLYYFILLKFLYSKLKSFLLSSIYFLIQNTLLIFIWVIGYDLPLMGLRYLLKSNIPPQYYILIYSLQICYLFAIILSLLSLNKKYRIWETMKTFDGKWSMQAFILIVTSNLILLVRLFFLEIHLTSYFYLSLILFLYSVFSIVTIFFVVSIYNKNLYLDTLISKNRKELEFIELANEFKHDFKTFLHTAQYYLKIDDIHGLKTYFNSLEKYSTNFIEPSLFQQIYLIDNKPLHGLLMKFIEECKESNLNLYLNIQPIKNFSENSFFSSLDFIRCFSILINNAREHSTENIYINFSESDKIILCSVRNTVNSPIKADKIFQKNYTTKKGHRGLGLHILSKIIYSYPSANIEVKNIDNWISFTIIYKK